MPIYLNSISGRKIEFQVWMCEFWIIVTGILADSISSSDAASDNSKAGTQVNNKMRKKCQ